MSRTSFLTAMLVFLLALMFTACEKKPSYDELRQENEELHGQLESVNEKIRNAQSELDSLKSSIADAEYDPCNADMSDLDAGADSVGSELDDAEKDSQ